MLFTLTSGKLITAAPYRGVLSDALNSTSDRVSDYSSSRMVFTEYTKHRILFYHQRSIRHPQIKRLLQEAEGIVVSTRGVTKFIRRYAVSGTTARRLGSGFLW